MKQSFDVKEYARLREEAKKMFQNKKTGDQDLFTDQLQLYKPIIQSTKELEKNLISGQHELIEQIVPALRTRNLPQIEFDREHSSPIPMHDIKTIDLDGELLNKTHRKNLQDMSLELPSEVYATNNIEHTLNKISKKNRSLGQYLGTHSMKTVKEKEVYKSQKQTLQIYEKKINGLAESIQFEVKEGEGLKKKKLVKLKRGKGRPKINPDVIYYKKPDQLIEKLNEYNASKQAGNTGLDNYISSILDELLETKTISKDDYIKIYKNMGLNR
jgi:hypothetical protein